MIGPADKTARLDLGFWYNPATEHIHLAAGGAFISTVNDLEGSARRHTNLYWKLARALRDAGKPHPVLPD